MEIETSPAILRVLEKPPHKSDNAVREIILGWLEAAQKSEITMIEITGIVDGESRSISYATTPKGPDGSV